jgi:hypothetical protein
MRSGSRRPWLWSSCVVLVACGDPSAEGEATSSDEVAQDTDDEIGTTEDGESNSDTGTSTDDDDADASTTDDDPSDSTDASDSSESEADDGIKFDSLIPDTPGMGGCEGQGGVDVEFSYIWISNTGEGTLTKLNTETLVEEGRFITRPDHAGRPSRTSVNLSGDVAVANRDGGITKFAARLEDCVDGNGMPGIQTSTGKFDVLAWDVEECRLWHLPLMGPSLASRPVAWTAGTQDPGTCKWVDQKLWTSTSLLSTQGSMQVLRLDGDTGMIEETIPAPGVHIGAWGAYGGAVDADDNFWFSTHGSATPPTLSRVTYDDLVLTTWPVPNGVSPYGMTFDSKGYAWVAGYAGGVARFDPETEMWNVVPNTGLGMQADGEGRVWVGAYGGMGTGTFAIDVETLEVIDFIPIPAGVTKGVSIDFYGYVWIVDMGNSAYKVDPETHMYEVYNGLNEAYTYSDMTGAGLKNVAFPTG